MGCVTWGQFGDFLVKYAPVFTAIGVPFATFFGRRLLHTIKKLVNDRLDAALLRISDLEELVKALQALQSRHNGGTTADTGSTATALRSDHPPE
jgi:hypothetical protein